MSKSPFLIVSTMILLVCCVVCPAWADDEPDGRLSQKVTMECAHVRLHTAIERIAAKTGVDIRTGTGGADWKVRDMPILVCARGIPLGRLLKSIADTNHLMLTKSKEKDDTVSYRLWRDRKYQAALDAYKETRKAAQVAAAGYDWDVLSKYKDAVQATSDDRRAAASNDPAESRLWSTENTALSNVICELGKRGKDSVLGGEVMTLTYNTAPANIRPYFREAFKAFAEAVEMGRAAKEGREPKPFDDAMLNDCFVKVSFDSMLNPNELGVEAWYNGMLSRMEGRGYAYLVTKADPKMPARPEVPKPSYPAEQVDGRYVELMVSEPGGPELLDRKVKIEAPKDKKPNYTDLLCALSGAIGHSIVAEGPAARYMGMVESINNQLPSMFGREISVREILGYVQNIDYVNWYLDEPSKLIMGRDRDWLDRLDALAPEKTVLEIQKKVNETGVGLDDLEPFINLTNAQRWEWFDRNPEAPELANLPSRSACEDMLRLYYSLSTAQKSLLKAGKRVPLAGIDMAWMGKMLRRQAGEHIQSVLMMGMPGEFANKALTAYAKEMKVLGNDALPDMSLRLEKKAMYGGETHYIFRVEPTDGGDAIHAESVGALPVLARKK